MTGYPLKTGYFKNLKNHVKKGERTSLNSCLFV